VIICLIKKKDRDRRYVENWRPISLLNVDYEIGSKALAARLEKLLPEIIHEIQCTHLRGRTVTIFDGVRSISDVVEYIKLYDVPRLVTTFHFERAFISLIWQFLFHTVRAFNFGDFLVQWVEVLCLNILICVMNVGFG